MITAKKKNNPQKNKKHKKIKDNLKSSRLLRVKASYETSLSTPSPSGLGQDRLGKQLNSYFEYLGVSQALRILCQAYKLIQKKKSPCEIDGK